jgi:hypothetical protein
MFRFSTAKSQRVFSFLRVVGIRGIYQAVLGYLEVDPDAMSSPGQIWEASPLTTASTHHFCLIRIAAIVQSGIDPARRGEQNRLLSQ